MIHWLRVSFLLPPFSFSSLHPSLPQSTTMSFYFVIVGTKDNPVYEAELGPTSYRANPSDKVSGMSVGLMNICRLYTYSSVTPLSLCTYQLPLWFSCLAWWPATSEPIHCSFIFRYCRRSCLGNPGSVSSVGIHFSFFSLPSSPSFPTPFLH